MNEVTYFNNFIAQKTSGIPYSTQWMVHIDRIPGLVSANLRDIDTQTWSIAKSNERLRQAVVASTNQVQGNIFAQAVTVPGERVDITRVGTDAGFRGGFNQAPILNSRNDGDFVNIDFLETRDSFIDMVIRPWIIQVGFNGLIAQRDPSKNIKTDLWAIYFDRGDAEKNEPPKIRKKWCFHNAVPISIDPDTVDYQKNQITILKTQWLYTHYTIGTD